eukprot:10812920-Alexandrium_andersonii.AAC.1
MPLARMHASSLLEIGMPSHPSAIRWLRRTPLASALPRRGSAHGGRVTVVSIGRSLGSNTSR